MTEEGSSPVVAFATKLRKLRERAGNPSLSDLVNLTTAVGQPLARSTMNDKLNGKSVVQWEFVSAMVKACDTHARSKGTPLPKDLVNLREWDKVHIAMLDAVADDGARARHAKAARDEQTRRSVRQAAGSSGSGGRNDSEALQRRANDWDPLYLSVRPAITVKRPPGACQLPFLPVYAEQAHDHMLDDLLELPYRSLMIVLVGDSATGKTRAAYEAVLRNLANWPLHRPVDGTDLLDLLCGERLDRPSVLWVDETQRYLDGSAGPAVAAALRRLLMSDGAPIVVIGTMWRSHWIRFTTQPSETVAALGVIGTDSDPHYQARELLQVATKIVVPETFTEPDPPWLADEPRLAQAFRVAGPKRRVIQVLAGGPVLVERYEESGTGLGRYHQALITAAMEARRLGCRSLLTQAYFAEAAPAYLDAAERADAPSDWLDIALAHATAEIHGIRALTPQHAQLDIGSPDGYSLDDYLDQYACAVRRTVTVPALVWDCLIRHTTEPDDRIRLAREAASRGLNLIAVRLLTIAADVGKPLAMIELAGLLTRPFYEDRVEDLLRRAYLTGDSAGAEWFSSWLAGAGRESEAERVLRRAADSGDARAIIGLAHMLKSAGRAREAEQWISALRGAAEDDDRTATLMWISWLTYEPHNDEDVRRWLLRAADAGIPEAIFCIRDHMRDSGWSRDDPELERVLRIAAGNGDSLAVNLFLELLTDAGRDHKLGPTLRNSAEAGSQTAIAVLETQSQKRGSPRPDRQWLQHVAASGNAGAMLLLAKDYLVDGREEEADDWLRLAAQANQWMRVTCSTDGCGSPSHADHQWLQRTVINDGNDYVVHIARRGCADWRQAERWLVPWAEAGCIEAIDQLAELMKQQGRTTELEQLLRQLTEIGFAREVEQQLGALLRDEGRHQEAWQISVYGIEPGGRTADSW